MRTFFLFAAFMLSIIPATLRAQDINNVNETDVVKTVRFYPNPVTNMLSITPSADMNNVFLFVSDVRGRIVAKAVLPNLPAGQEYHYQMNDFSDGIYVCILRTGDEQFSQRIMVQ
jgi:hypothetical protein